MRFWGVLMANSQNLAPSFCRFAWRMHERLSPERLSEEDKQRLFEIIHALLDAMNTGEVCVDLKRVTTPETFSSIKALLLRSRLAAEGEANDVLFVIDDNDRLYLHRFYRYEVRLAQRLKALKDHHYSLEDEAFHLDSLFKSLKNKHGVDMQALAVAVAQTSALTVISGGPGTGKTWTVVKILEALLLREPALRIAMCAPTGKAAARMSESVRNSLNGVTESVRARIPTKAQTVHRLLRQADPLPYDVVVLDEASMVSLELMARLVEHMPSRARLICLGDKDQLASVDPGAVFAELSQTFAFSEPALSRLNRLGFDTNSLKTVQNASLTQRWNLVDHTVWLTHSYRFDDQKGIGRLARFVREGLALDAVHQLDELDDHLAYYKLDECAQGLDASVESAIVEAYRPYFKAVNAYFAKECGLEEVFVALHRFGLLCALNEGPFGVDALNDLIVRTLQVDWPMTADGHFPGEVIMVAVNDQDLRLNNGDVGVVLKTPEGQLEAYFETVDEAGRQTYRPIPVGRLPEYKRAFAITIHKSQGSEYDRVMMVLPPVSKLLTRELCYTGITRAKHHLTVVATKDSIRRAVMTPTERISGLLTR